MSTTAPDTSAFFQTWGTQREMNELEATMWRGERHPVNSSTGAIVEFLDGTPEWERVVSAHEHFLELVPRFKRRVQEPALPLAPPVWVPDERFDLGYHLRRVTLAAPGDERQLLEFVQTCALTPIDRSRAPWNAYFVEGLAGGKSAYVTIVHHCLMDGNSAMSLLAHLQPRDQRDTPTRPGLTPRVPEAAGSTSALALAARQALGQFGGAPRTVEQFAGATFKVLRGGPVQAAEFVASLKRMISPPEAAPSALMNSGTRSAWRFGVLQCELAELKAAGKAAGGTVNDAYVAAILGGLRRYHEAVGAELGDIPMSMPVSVRSAGDESGGNRFTAAFLAAPTSIADPGERIRALGEVVRRIQGEPALDAFSVLLPGLNRTPEVVMASAFTAMQDRADLTVSNVIGAPWTLHFGGVAVERLGCFGALPGSAMTTVLCSYDGGCTIGINCDGGAFTDHDLLFELMDEALREVIALGAPA
jgi:WS/DGAT/MGAT family acyltransferase